MEIRYCIEYINPRHPLRDNGSLNVRYDRVLTLNQAEHDLTLILSFGGKILDLYMGNVAAGKTGEWNPIPMIVDDDDWFTTDWLKTLEMKEVDWEHLEQEVQDFCERFDARKESWYNMTPHDQKLMASPTFANFAMQIAKHFFEIGMRSTITEEDCKLIWNIGDGLPCMKEEDFFKELLRRYKAQKGE